MFKSKLEQFIAKRAAIGLFLLSVADIFFLKSNKWPVLAGLVAGALLSMIRFVSNSWINRKMIGADGRTGKTAAGGIALFIMSQFILLPLLALAYFADIWLFIGFFAGILLVPSVIMINSITEAFGMTKNGFE